MVVNSLGFPFVSCIIDYELKKLTIWNTDMCRQKKKKSPNKSLLSLAKVPGKGKPSNTENLALENNQLTSAKHHQQL